MTLRMLFGEPIPPRVHSIELVHPEHGLLSIEYIPIAGYQCIRDDYDGAPDAGPQPVGHGETAQAALDAFLESAEG